MHRAVDAVYHTAERHKIFLDCISLNLPMWRASMGWWPFAVKWFWAFWDNIYGACGNLTVAMIMFLFIYRCRCPTYLNTSYWHCCCLLSRYVFLIPLALEGRALQTPGSNGSRVTHRHVLSCECLHSDVRAAPTLRRSTLSIGFFQRRFETQGITDTETWNKYNQVVSTLTVFTLRTRYHVCSYCPFLSGDAQKNLNCDFITVVWRNDGFLTL
jgi:hypothetical protein